MTVKAFRTINGEELIAVVLKETDDSYFISNPCYIIITEDNSGKQGVSLAPCMPYAVDDSVEIMKQTFAFRCDPEPNLANSYLQMFDDSRIELINPSKKIIV